MTTTIRLHNHNPRSQFPKKVRQYDNQNQTTAPATTKSTTTAAKRRTTSTNKKHLCLLSGSPAAQLLQGIFASTHKFQQSCENLHLRNIHRSHLVASHADCSEHLRATASCILQATHCSMLAEDWNPSSLERACPLRKRCMLGIPASKSS